ncbi:MAG: hypothetical protein KME15_11850 [Drouetiella hepatica Uher 2000/2452]|uniref:Chromosome segregation ATPase n=1 Tax=Drouetiella hepatica Uher 2000/2452 TaxID=904376 RepID=A0A951UM73_9CYAN|nr:hypothetical protein [Drouetiella hepatica Uher 2000/2452]
MAEQKFEQSPLEENQTCENPASGISLNRLLSRKSWHMGRLVERSPQPAEEIPGNLSPGKPPSSKPPSSKSPSGKPRAWTWSLAWLAILGVFGGMGTSALLWLITLPPPVNCQNPAKLTLDGERLYCAREAARSGELPKIIAGLDLVKSWDEDHPLQGEAQNLREEWSKRLFVVARNKVDQSDMKGAMAIISHIPKNTEIYADVQKSVTRWKKQWAAGEAIANKALVAMKQQKWDDAYAQIAILNESSYDYWRLNRAVALAQQLGAEKQAWQVLNQAKKVVVDGSPYQLSQAIALAQQVPPNTYAQAETHVQVQQWSQKLLRLGIAKWKEGDTTSAATLLRLPDSVTILPELAPEMADLMQFAGAYRLAGRISSRWLPSVGQIWDMQEAIAAIQQVKPDSPFYPQAQIHRKNWQTQLQDMIQLQYASAIASLGQRDSFKLAVSQAQKIGVDRPRRGQAQTLIFFWTGEMQRVEDQPYLARAKALAQSGQIPALKAAIAEAKLIAPNRTLSKPSQDLIASWQAQIETLEDQPILNQAIALAEQGDLEEAIDRAGKIRAGRALYAQAQGKVSDWQFQIIINAQIAADQPILDRASALANNGDLTLAISVASQISPGRALYDQAQGAISRWRVERDSIINAREYARPSYSPDTAPSSEPKPSGFGSTPLPLDRNSPLSPVEPEPLPSLELVDPSAPASDSPVEGDDQAPIIVEPQPIDPALPDLQQSRPQPSYEGYYDQRYYQDSQ